MEDMTMIKITKSLRKDIKILAAKEGLPTYKYLGKLIMKEIENETASK